MGRIHTSGTKVAATQFGGGMSISVSWEWSDVPQMIVEPRGGGLHVRAHPSLSEGQVRQACEALGEHGPTVLEAWGRAVGLET